MKIMFQLSFEKGSLIKMKKYLFVALLCVVLNISVYSSVLGGESKDLRVREISGLRLLEEITVRLDAGTPLSPEQERMLFPEMTPTAFTYFLALNYKDRRIQRLKKLASESNLDNRKKEYVLGVISLESRRNLFDWLCENGRPLPPMLPERERDEIFAEKPVPPDEQFSHLRRLAAALEAYRAALDSPDGTDASKVRLHLEKSAALLLTAYAFPRPSDETVAAKLGEFFAVEIYPLLWETRMREERNFFSKNVDIYALCGIDMDSLIFTDSYLVDYVALKTRERIIARKKSRADAAGGNAE